MPIAAMAAIAAASAIFQKQQQDKMLKQQMRQQAIGSEFQGVTGALQQQGQSQEQTFRNLMQNYSSSLMAGR
jgi:cell division protein ZapA (FtsZ GTPase activity inhibitor)